MRRTETMSPGLGGTGKTTIEVLLQMMESGFKAFKVTRQFTDALEEMGVVNPTDIQAKALPPALAGQDVLGVARTGSGKTLAYLIPLVMRIKYAQGQHPRALILVPSKELAVQVQQNLIQLTKYTDIRSVVIYGGVGKKAQVEAIDAGVDITVATPGRFLDLYALGHVYPRAVKILVLDEADRMMDMGFMPQLRRVLDVIPVKRQNFLFSATFPEKVEHLAAEFLDFPTRVFGESPGKPVEEVHQLQYHAPNFRSKLNLLKHFLGDENMTKVMVFCRTKDVAERVSRYLGRMDVGEVRVLHANKGQNTRLAALDAFGEGTGRVLVTTDVSARGLDIENVSHVINFEVPRDPVDYLHRIGRTARIHREGHAISLVSEVEEPYMEAIAKALDSKVELQPWPEGVPYGEDLPGEKRQREMEKDFARQRRDPNYKGAFHKKTKRRRKR